MRRFLNNGFGFFTAVADNTPIFLQADSSNPTGNTTVYFCSTPQAPATNQNNRAVISLSSGKIKKCNLIMNTTAGNAGSDENISVYLRINRTTDYLVKTVGSTDAVRIFDNYAMDIPIAQGDIIEAKVVYPTWGTPPAAVHWSGNFMIAN